jgi:regulator of protease activity HflC (stomatin/prohibitin superfamily)
MTTLLVLLFGAGGYGLGRLADRRRPPLLPVWLALAGGFLGGLLAFSIFMVPPAHVGVLYNPLRGGIQLRTVVPEGLNFVSPFTTREVFSVQTQEYTMSSVQDEAAVVGDDSILCQTNEGLGTKLDLTVLFHVDPARAPYLWASLGPDYPETFIRPLVREAIRMVVARYSVVDVYSGSRAKIQQQIDEGLRAVFEKYGLILEDVKLRNVQYANEPFKQAITEKQAAQQQVSTEQRNLERAAYEKETKINEAMGEYQSIAKKAQALNENPEILGYLTARKLGPSTRVVYMQTPFARTGRGR